MSRAINQDDYEVSSSPLVLKWDRRGSAETWMDTPEAVLISWRKKFVFAVEDLDAELPGLKMPLVGALSHGTADQILHEFVGAGVDRLNARIDEHAAYRIFQHIAMPAEQL